MRHVFFILIISLFPLFSQGHSNFLESKAIPIYMAIDGIAIATMWTVDIYNNNLLEDGFFKSNEGGKLFWPHLVAEYGTAAGLVISAYGLYNDRLWGEPLALISLGALTYTSLSNLSWSLAEKNRYIYAVPMILSLTGASISIGIMF